jgi:zinc-binding alcohol dehydrogenase/oxidoreductase
MKAVVLKETGGPKQLKVEEVADPVPGPGEVVVQLRMAALNRRDVFITYGQYPGIKLPAIPGSDGAGEVVEAGESVGADLLGAEVVINPGLHWGDNPRVNNRTFSILGVPVDGTYAQYVKVPVENVYQKPSYLSWEEAAAIPLGALTAYRALVTRGNVQEGETVLIPGAGGGVATFLVQIAAVLGAKVFVTSSEDEKISKAKALGAAGGVNYRSDHWVKDLKVITGGVDLSVDSIGGQNFDALISLAKPGSRIVSFGATTGSVPNLVMPKVFLKQLDILGTAMGSQKEFAEMLDFFEKHHIRPTLDETYPLEKAVEAQNRMDKGENFGKILLEIPQ